MTWHTVDLSELIAKIESGGRPHGGASVDSGEIPSLGGENIRLSGGLELEKVKKVPLSFFGHMTKGLLQNEDVLINKDGANTGKIGFFEKQFPKACINEHVFLLRGNPQNIVQRYLYYLLLSQYSQGIIRSKISGSAQPGLKRDFIKNFTVPIPDQLSEQYLISDILTTVDFQISYNDALILKYQRIKIGLMRALLTRGIDEDGQLRQFSTHQFKETSIGLIPRDWEVFKLADLTTKIIDGTHHTPNYVASGIPFVTVKNLTGSTGIDLSDVNYVTVKDHKELIKRVRPCPGDVLVTKDGTLGTSRIVPNNFPEFSIFVSVALLRPNSKCISEWLWLFFESGLFEKQLGQLSAGTGLRHIHLEHFKQFQIATPSPEEQKKIASIIDCFQLSIYSLNAKLKKLHMVKTGLMQGLLSGETTIMTTILEK